MKKITFEEATNQISKQAIASVMSEHPEGFRKAIEPILKHLCLSQVTEALESVQVKDRDLEEHSKDDTARVDAYRLGINEGLNMMRSRIAAILKAKMKELS